MRVSAGHPSKVRRLLPTGWPVYALFMGYPLMWALGFKAVMGLSFSVMLLVLTLIRGRLRVPRGFGVWVFFMIWVLVSSTQIDGANRWIAYGYRLSSYLTATLLFLYVFNSSQRDLPSRKVIYTLAGFWMVVVIGGFLGLLYPQVTWHSFAERFVPERMLDVGFVQELFRPGFADASNFLTHAQVRPSAPFTYTNEWGANLAILTPILIATWTMSRSRVWNVLSKFLFVAAMLPIIASLNRGLWLSLGVGVIYAAIRLAGQGKLRALVSVLVVGLLAGMFIYFTPLGQVGAERIATPHSNKARSTLYEETRDRVLESPLIGHGGPRPSEKNPNLPSVGTHGQLWLLLFSQGVVGALLYIGWFIIVLGRSARGTPAGGIWLHTAILVALVQLPFYEHLPMHVMVMMTVSAVIMRDLSVRAKSPVVDQKALAATPVPALARL